MCASHPASHRQPTPLHQGWNSPPWLTAAATALLLAIPLQARAQNFQVYCTNNSDGTTTCTGWQGGETLTCVNNAGGTSSCSSSSGRNFVCILDSGGVASCNKANGPSAIERPAGSGTNCTFTGQGNFTCDPPQRKTPETIPSPRITDPVLIDQPPQIDPSINFDLIQPLSP
jgi:hypothetical protein